MDSIELKKRTQEFGVAVIKMVDSLPNNKIGDIVGKQLLRSATSVGANYRSACKARSKADFISRIMIVEEEADESLYWMEIIRELKLLPEKQLTPLLSEANELTATFASTAITAKTNLKKQGLRNS
jgi:four helix bundle protein